MQVAVNGEVCLRLSSAKMITTSTTTHDPLYPPPLHIQKKPRKASFRRRIFRKSSHKQSDDQFVFGPLDDIIDEIKGDIWELPPDRSLDLSTFDWTCPLEAPLSWATAPLPVSRTPKDHTLTIRKNRDSRSTASGSSLGDPMAHIRNHGQEEPANGGPVCYPHTAILGALPMVDAMSYEAEASDSSTSTEHVTAQQALENVIGRDGDPAEPPRRRTSRLRRLTSGFTLLRRQGTGEASASTTNVLEVSSPIAISRLATQDETEDDRLPNDSAVEAYIMRNARNGEWFSRFMGFATQRMPSPAGTGDEVSMSFQTLPTTLRVATRLYSEVKILTKDVEEFNVALDIEAVLHNRRPLPDTSIDVIFLVDNGYYVSHACLEKALDVVKAAFHHLDQGDRLALYTTHCTHRDVTGNRPEQMFPIRPVCADANEMIRELAHRIVQSGTQLWDPPRPNPSMTDVILCVAKSMQREHLKANRTHLVVLSPAAHVLHGVSRFFPDLYIHQINPAILPYSSHPEFQDTGCVDRCCENVFASNRSKYQSTSGRIKTIIRNARSKKPVGDLTELSVDIRAHAGCEIIQCHGSTEIPQLRLGQLQTIFLRIRVTKSETQSVRLDSTNPIYNSSLDANGLRQELLNSVHVGANKVHLLGVQILHHNSIHEPRSWNYTEKPLVITREIGGLTPPKDNSMEVYKRLYFYKLVHAPKEETDLAAEGTVDTHSDTFQEVNKLFECMMKEMDYHVAVHEYEKSSRQRLPVCPGPIDMEVTHDWLTNLWTRTRTRHIEGLECLEHPA
ncbi:haus augmin-like complex subunit 8 isoform x1 [Pyrenophora seminiperda CCB06]|uniref:Haus augmin-like complex subunit 8 isoform x1 n=1 Tax=Pyrenophora seminiperda CCB06 TaxID=1302712 RepID=A0A3M7MHB8_9PLEO|nr:haus augmin-like complex subunit 8 isoform x1 [Pyrenophora seminiperda CCB06]